MLQTFYNNFGFLGSLGIAFGGFLFIIFWVSGIAGICDSETTRFKTAKMILSVVFPPYPFFWILFDMYAQRQQMKES
ncbi:hypothetical protein ACG2F4_08370 [Halalkalibaculum sp. DA3122]|uniref:hypothetical protein n=1 Tax=unclassified Halalkalibaculum TaxID=2964617 RepID=UPI0037551DAC